MKVEYWEASPRQTRAYEAFAATAEGKAFIQREKASRYRILEWRMKHENFVPSEDTMRAYQKWKAEHPNK